MKQSLKEICLSYDIDSFGIAPPGPYQELEEILNRRISAGNVTGMEEKDLRKRIDPQLTMPNTKSVIVCLFPYHTAGGEDCNISAHARGADYHGVITERLNSIAEDLKKEIPNFEYIVFTDTGPLVDRYLAYRAGLGFYGMNNCLINEKYGSCFFIGYILNNYPFEPDKPQENKCLQCETCLKACPGSALGRDFEFNPRNCLSNITQKKGELSEQEIKLLKSHNLVYGCDRCQDVCPFNQDLPETPIRAFKTDLISRIDCCDLEGLSSKEFKKKYAGRTFSWRGKSTLIRNLKHIRK